MPAKDPTRIDIEVAFATPETQVLQRLSLPAGATLGDALLAAKIETSFPQYDFGELATGIWGRLATREQRLQDGDRVEIYRALEVDPMEARRIRARDSTPDPSGSR